MNHLNAYTFGVLESGSKVFAYPISAGKLRATVLGFGATLQELYLEGCPHSLILGSASLTDYRHALKYAGAIVGPVANRISNGHFRIGAQAFDLDKNFLHTHCLHGGQNAASGQVWQLIEHQESEVTLGLELADKHMGFPGPISITVRYALNRQNQLSIDIRVRSEQIIPCSWTGHAYFNLDGSAQLSGHRLQVDADRYLPVDAELIPSGEVRPVSGSAFDLRQATSLTGLSLDHNFCITDQPERKMRKVARLDSIISGISMQLESNEPGLQVYTGDHLRTEACSFRAGIALEPQGWPDALNQPSFPSILFRPGETYHHQSCYTFTQTVDRST
ncbi:MAG: aldose epimerase family protein [Thiolinea sp.]